MVPKILKKFCKRVYHPTLQLLCILAILCPGCPGFSREPGGYPGDSWPGYPGKRPGDSPGEQPGCLVSPGHTRPGLFYLVDSSLYTRKSLLSYLVQVSQEHWCFRCGAMVLTVDIQEVSKGLVPTDNVYPHPGLYLLRCV